MHLTWQPGDPVVQLNFPNPLNVSVQVGDVAYFSNPTAVGQPQEWTATTTPHLANPQSGVMMIGEIVQIIPWNGTVSSIICNMPQALFNQYFAQIIAGGCTDDTNSPPLTNSCDGATIYETEEDMFTVAFSPGNHSTLFQFIGVYGGGSWASQNTCDAYRVTRSWIDGSGVTTHGGFMNAEDTLNHFINVHNLTNLTSTSSYSDFVTELTAASAGGLSNFGHTGKSFSPCRCTYSETCTQGSFIMFSKDNKVNMSDMLGYYASVELRNNSTTEAELFNVGTTFFESSK